MSGIQRPAVLEALNTKLFTLFQEGMKVVPFGQAEQLWTEVPSDSEFNTYGWLAAIAGMREWIGPRVFHGLKERVFQIYNKHYENSIAVNLDRLADGQIADAQMAMSSLAQEAAMLPEDLLVALLEGGQAVVGYDGQFLFDTDHPTNIDSVTGTQRNYYASGLALDATNLNTAIVTMMGYRAENGRPLRSNPNLLIVPPALYKTALDLVEAKTLSAGGENTYASKFNLKVVVLQRATSATRWWLVDTQSPGPKPFILQRRLGTRFVSRTSPNDSNVFEQNEAQWGVDARLGMGPGLWFRIFSAQA